MGDDCYHFSDIAGYNFLDKPRVNRIGRGVGLYNGEHLNYKEGHDLSSLRTNLLNPCLLKLIGQKKRI